MRGTVRVMTAIDHQPATVKPRTRPHPGRITRAIRLRPGRVPTVSTRQRVPSRRPRSVRLHRFNQGGKRHANYRHLEDLPRSVRLRRLDGPGAAVRPPATLRRAGGQGLPDSIRHAPVPLPASPRTGTRPRGMTTASAATWTSFAGTTSTAKTPSGTARGKPTWT